MIKLVHFPDLQERRVAKSRAQLRNLIKKYGFPPGRMLGPNTRAWTEDEVDAWLASRPVEGPELRGIAKAAAAEAGDAEAAAEVRRARMAAAKTRRARKAAAETATT